MFQTAYRCPLSNNYDYLNGDQVEKKRENRKMTVFGEGRVSVKPDIATVSIGFTNEGKQLEMVQQENAKISQQIINSIKSMGISSKDIQTQSYNVNVEYDYVEGKQVFRGYRVTNILSITIREFTKVGAVIDSAVKAGANIVNDINFLVSSSDKYYEKALRISLENAQRKAFAMAEKLKVRVNPIPVSITEQGRNVGILPVPMSAKVLSQVETPIEAGENEIIANVEAIFIYNE